MSATKESRSNCCSVQGTLSFFFPIFLSLSFSFFLSSFFLILFLFFLSLFLSSHGISSIIISITCLAFSFFLSCSVDKTINKTDCTVVQGKAIIQFSMQKNLISINFFFFFFVGEQNHLASCVRVSHVLSNY